MLGRGVWGPGRRVRLYRVTPGPVPDEVGSGARGRPGLSTPLAEFAQSQGKGLGPGTHSSWLPLLPVSPPHARVAAHYPGSDNLGKGPVWKNSAATGGTFAWRSSSSEILPEWEGGGGAQSSLHLLGGDG